MPNKANKPIPIEHLDPKKIKRILVCQLRQLGDVILTTPALELLHQRFPEAEIHFFTEKKCADLVLHNPHIHTLWQVEKQKLPTLLHEVLFYYKVARNNFDLVIDFQQLPRCRWVVAFSRAKIRLTFTPPWYNRLLYTHWSDPTTFYNAGYKADILAPLGIRWNLQKPKIYLTQTEQESAKNLFQSLGISPPYITFDVPHRRPTRKWPATYYAELIQSISAKYPEFTFVLPYGPGEQEDSKEVYNLCTCKDRIIVPKKMLTLRELAALIKGASLHIGNCSSPRHIAVAFNVPTITMLGSTDKRWSFPSPEHLALQANLDCQPCNKNTCPHMRCLFELTPAKILPAVLAHIAAYKNRTLAEEKNE